MDENKKAPLTGLHKLRANPIFIAVFYIGSLIAAVMAMNTVCM